MSSPSELLGGPDFARLFGRVRQRLEREPQPPMGARVSLPDPTPGERRAVGGLVGRRFVGKTVSVRIDELDQALRNGTGRGLRAWLEKLGGALQDRPAQQQARKERIAAALERVRQSSLEESGWFQVWLAELEGAPLTRMANEGTIDRLDQAVAVLEALPVDDVPIALFASLHLGSTKALDDTPVERLVLRALALWAGCPRPTDASTRRTLWERFGVLPDDLASQVLVLNLPAVGEGPVDRMLREAAGHGLPLRLTLQQLTRFPPLLAGHVSVFVCENPAVLRFAAERLGARCAALVTTEGRPSTACWRLLARTSGPLRVRADFDKDGLEIAAQVFGRHPGRSRPWRFDTATYAKSPHTDVPLPDELPPTPWDPALRVCMAGAWRVEEEQLLDVLLGDLGGQTG